jgi:2-polyprenyl-3-methyl-5-hydroxy-6-metoxy-1,4-benzoquinol methylase
VLGDAGVCPDPRVRDEQSDLYGRRYWFDHQQSLYGQADIHARSRSDLGERCVYWLDALTRLKLPPARVLELGSAHGGFVHLMRQAGYDAIGSELSPSVCRIAEQTFNVPMMCGPVEDLPLSPGTFDAIVLMDVLEHMPDPLASMRHCARLLKPDGLLLVQTPCTPTNDDFAKLSNSEDRFLAHLKPLEHLNLFTKDSARLLMERVGLKHVQVLPAIYWFYDMFFCATAVPLAEIDDVARWSHFSRNPSLRTIGAMLDAEQRFRGLLEKHRKVTKGHEFFLPVNK